MSSGVMNRSSSMTSPRHDADEEFDDDDDDINLDDVPLTLAYETRYLEDEGRRGAAAAASSSSGSCGVRPPALPLGGKVPGILQSSFATSLSHSLVELPDSDIPSPPDSRTQLTLPNDFELSFNAIKPPADLPRADEPPPTSRQKSQTQPPPFSLSRLKQPQPAASTALPMHAPTSMHAPPPSSSPPHVPPPASSTVHGHAMHPASNLRPPSADHPQAPPHAPAEPLSFIKSMTQALKPPRLHLENPATASPVMSPLNTARIRPASSATAAPPLHPGLSYTDLLPAPGQSHHTPGKRLLVSLLTPAFSIPHPSPALATSTSQPTTSGATPRNRSPPHAAATAAPAPPLAHLISSSLGLRPQQPMRCFTLTEVPYDQLSAAGAGGSSHVAVLPEGCSFSLASLEDLLRTNQQLIAGHEASARTIGALQADFKAAAAAGQEAALRGAAAAAELAAARRAASAAEAEVDALRAQLRSCDEQRLHFRGMLASLRERFERSTRGWMQAVGADPDAGVEPGQGSEAGIEGELLGLSLEPTGSGGGPAGSGMQAGGERQSAEQAQQQQQQQRGCPTTLT